MSQWMYAKKIGEGESMKPGVIAVGMLMIVGATGVRAQAPAAGPAGPWIGNWKLNLEKSRFNYFGRIEMLWTGGGSGRD